MAATNSTVKTTTSLIPKSARHLLNATNYLCEAIEIGCKGVRDATASADEISRIYLEQHKARLLADLA